MDKFDYYAHDELYLSVVLMTANESINYYIFL